MPDAEVTSLRPWLTTAVVHIWPGNDRIDHDVLNKCVCKPTLEYQETEQRILITHRALDGRKN